MQAINDAPRFHVSKTLEKFLRSTPTPLFLYDEKSLVQAAQALFAAFAHDSKFLPRFPVRMNPNPAVLRIFRENGCGALCRSLPELELAARCGFQGRQIAYEPAILNAKAEEAAHAIGAVFVLDSAGMLPQKLPESAVLLLRQQGPLRCGGRAVTGVPASCAGMDREPLMRLAESLCAHGVRRIGLGMRLGELCMDEAFYPAIFAQLAALAQTLYERTGILADALDLGGGFGISYRPGFAGPSLPACAAAIGRQRQTLSEPLRGIALQMSPGRALAAPGGILAARVLTVKPGLPPAAILDVQSAQCLRLARSGAYHPVEAIGSASRQSRLQILACAAQDGLAMRQVLPELRPGDLVLIGMLGADGRSLSACYGGAEPCPEYLIRTDGSIEDVTAY